MNLLSYNGRTCDALLPNLLSSGEVTKYCLVFTINDVFLICNWFVEISDQLRGYSIFHVLCNFFLIVKGLTRSYLLVLFFLV